ncbi:MAG: hypothetical protein M1826_004994 [Phylliscum demangeonii]|nr:MAG: hypothetical protein M1826_004994 [Phylliscum demangeonii]
METAAIGVFSGPFDAGIQRSHVQYIAVLDGLVHITIPNSTQELWLGPGQTPLFLATDTILISDNGHDTIFPTRQQTTSLQIQPAGDSVPPCRALRWTLSSGTPLMPSGRQERARAGCARNQLRRARVSWSELE